MMTFEPRSKSYNAKMYTEVMGENILGRDNSKLRGPKAGKTNHLFSVLLSNEDVPLRNL